MADILTVLFWLAISAIALTYLIYPVLVIYLPLRPKNPEAFQTTEELPPVTVIMAAYNEESVIREKLHSVFQGDYPTDKLEVLVGSDKSSDGTDDIVLDLTRQYPNLQLVRFEHRTGKSGIINKLVELSQSSIIVATDANIIFKEDTLYHLIKCFKEPEIALVGGNLIYKYQRDTGIAAQEHVYLNWENRIKQRESQRWQLVIGVEGGCYAIRKAAFPTIPPLTFMEDFFVTMQVLKQGKRVWFEPEAICFEDVSTQILEEYKRKVRISIGNWQNFNRFASLLFNPPYPLGLAFFCHKVLRWFTPFLAIFSFGSAVILSSPGNIYSYFTMLVIAVLLLLPLDFALMRLNMHTGILRFINHFVMMNIALLTGFLKYSKGIETNVWQPTKRNQ
jgi:cellulose synthase/poly-beta-1,6-N-acetylglucosamine synthase-like glycosyltransferase